MHNKTAKQFLRETLINNGQNIIKSQFNIIINQGMDYLPNMHWVCIQHNTDFKQLTMQ